METENIAVEMIDVVSGIFDKVRFTYDTNVQEIERAEGEINDLLHEIELSTPKNAVGGYLMYKAIRDARVRRRKAKDENELLRDLYSFLQDHTDFKNKLTQIKGRARTAGEKQGTRVYTPRQRDDLTIPTAQSQVHKPFEQMMSEFKQTKVRMQGGKLRK